MRDPDPALDELRQARQDNKARHKPNSGQDASDVRLEDFCAYMPAHAYIFAPTREMWPAGSVNARVGAVPVGNGKVISASDGWTSMRRLSR
jgi:hypothetical protein